jgi:serine/threonine protein kinase
MNVKKRAKKDDSAAAGTTTVASQKRRHSMDHAVKAKRTRILLNESGGGEKEPQRKKERSAYENHSHSTVSSNPITSAFGNCTNVSLRYKKQCRIGEGTYGIVYKALDTITKQPVALKRCLPHHEASDGFPITTLREIQILKEIQEHENIVQLKEVAVSSNQSGVFLVFEYAHFDLANLVDEYYVKYAKGPFTVPETKRLAKQLLSAIEYLHDKCIIHRDLKLSNLLYDKERGILKLCDFGLARRISTHGHTYNHERKRRKVGYNANNTSKMIPITPPPEHLTPKVVSLWYRPPELLLNSENYDFSVDSWGAGCVIAELLLGIPLFKGTSELNQLEKIADLLGPPTLKLWPGLQDMPLFKDGNYELPFSDKSWSGRGRSKFLDKFSNLSTAGIVLLSKLLQYDPTARWTLKSAHACTWFKEFPLPTNCHKMPTFPWKK